MPIRTLASLLALVSFSTAQETRADWRTLRSVREVCEHFPDRVRALFSALDLDRPELAAIKEAFAAGDLVAASESLLRDYRGSATASWLRLAPLEAGSRRKPTADALLADRFTFEGLEAEVPRLEDGRLDWDWLGPEHDREFGWSLNRHFLIRDLFAAYRDTGNAIYVDALDAHLRDWLTSSPYPGRRSSTPRWRGLEVHFRAKYWSQVFFGLQQDERFRPATRLLLLATVPKHADYLRRFHAKGGNWVTMEMSGLASLAAAFPEFRDADVWWLEATDRLERELVEQVYPDGAQKELTAGYHFVALSNFEQLDALARASGRRLGDDYEKGMEGMWNYLVRVLEPDGATPQNNDSDHNDVRNAVLKAADRYARPDWRYVVTNGTSGEKPGGSPSAVFPFAGQLVTRNGWDRDAAWGFFDFGPWVRRPENRRATRRFGDRRAPAGKAVEASLVGAKRRRDNLRLRPRPRWGLGHQHNDALHVSATAFGRRLLVDSGRFAYSGTLADKFRRAYALHSRGHNVVLIDGRGQGPGPRTVDAPAHEDSFGLGEKFDWARGSFARFDGIEGEVEHTRTVIWLHDRMWIVVDRIAGDRPRRLEALWHFHPDCRVAIEGAGVVTSNLSPGNLRIVPLGELKWQVRLARGEEQPELQGWHSEQYHDAIPSTTAVFTTEASSDAAFAWILLPSKGAPPALDADLERDGERLHIRVRTESWDLVVPLRTGAPQLR